MDDEDRTLSKIFQCVIFHVGFCVLFLMNEMVETVSFDRNSKHSLFNSFFYVLRINCLETREKTHLVSDFLENEAFLALISILRLNV